MRPARLLGGAGILLVLLAALFAAFGWLDLLRQLGAARLGPAVTDALPLRRLAGASSQPLARVGVAFVSCGLLAGLALARLPRAARGALLLLSSFGLLAIASEAAYAIQENVSISMALRNRHPGLGVLAEAALFAVAGVLPAVRLAGRLREIRLGPGQRPHADQHH